MSPRGSKSKCLPSLDSCCAQGALPCPVGNINDAGSRYIRWRVVMMEMAVDRLRIGSCKSMSNYHVVDSYKVIHVIDLTGLARAYWRYWRQRHQTVLQTFVEHYPNLVSQTFVTCNSDCKVDFSINVWQHLPTKTFKHTTFVDPRHNLSFHLPQIVGEWPKEFSVNETAPSVCTAMGRLWTWATMKHSRSPTVGLLEDSTPS